MSEKCTDPPYRRVPGLVLLSALVACLACSSAFARQVRVVVLPVEFLKADYFPDADRISAGERARLQLVADLVRQRLRRENYQVVDGELTRAAVTRADPGTALHECNGCERDIAADLGADWVLVGWIQMVSNLIVNLNMVAYDVAGARRVAHAYVDLRGNTERSWRRATEYMLERMLVERLDTARARAGAAMR